MKKWLLVSALILTPAAFASTENWYTIPLSYFRSMTLAGNNSTIVLQSPTGSTTTVTVDYNGGTTGTVSLSQISITPPAGREKEWESLILTGMSMGASIKVTGSNAGTVVTSPSAAGVTPFINFVIP
ncbi:MAG: hypothetical protein JWP91_2491 [Fibrobacteres bacterium]|nr:hypothetical protein [Fibrobacterota bacterium]